MTLPFASKIQEPIEFEHCSTCPHGQPGGLRWFLVDPQDRRVVLGALCDDCATAGRDVEFFKTLDRRRFDRVVGLAGAVAALIVLAVVVW